LWYIKLYAAFETPCTKLNDLVVFELSSEKDKQTDKQTKHTNYPHSTP